MATYILKRKYFSTQLTEERNRVLNRTKTSIQEILKLIFLSNSCKGDIDHWINHLSTTLTESGDPIKIFLGVVDNYKHLTKQFNKSYINSLRKNKDTKEYLKELIRSLKNKKEKEILKYNHLIPNPNQISDKEIEEILKKLKYIALCLSNQLNYEYDNWWDESVINIEVDWRVGNGMAVNSKYLRKIIENII